MLMDKLNRLCLSCARRDSKPKAGLVSLQLASYGLTLGIQTNTLLHFVPPRLSVTEGTYFPFIYQALNSPLHL